jgi:hypothetical protein
MQMMGFVFWMIPVNFHWVELDSNLFEHGSGDVLAKEVLQKIF